MFDLHTVHKTPQPWLNLRLAWLVVSGQLESTLFNSSLALCLTATGDTRNRLHLGLSVFH